MLKAIKETSVKIRRKFDETFKREAVQNWLASGKSAQVIAKELGLLPNRLYAWRKRFAPADAGGRGAAGAKPGSVADLQGQLDAAVARDPAPARTAGHFKKNTGHSLRTVAQRYERIDAMKSDYPILVLCEHLEVSASGYYDWQKRRTALGPRALANQTLAQQIKAIHAQSRQTYGSPRIVDELRKQGCRHGRNRIARLMQQAELCGRQKGRYRVQTTDSNHDQPIAPNRLAQAPKATAPNQLWVADITYIETQEGWLYLAAILDLYSRKIVGWAMSERIDTALVLKALAMALLHRQPPANLLIHSDRGVQYASADYRQALGSGRPDRLHEPQSQLL